MCGIRILRMLQGCFTDAFLRAIQQRNIQISEILFKPAGVNIYLHLLAKCDLRMPFSVSKIGGKAVLPSNLTSK